MAKAAEDRYPMLTGASPLMREVFDLIDKIADTESTVIIYGESGTGKERAAKTIHQHSSRREKPFVPVNCAAIPATLLESELFGHEKGAFTGAHAARAGRFELADTGTIFLDEVGELHPQLQVKLLRVLQEREFERVGGSKTLSVDVRVLAATNRDLEKATRDGSFREDLFYRLNVIPLHMPPLRQRHDDIPLLVDHFVARFSRRKKRDALGVDPEAMECLLRYPWPGNVRELENLIERLVILTDGDTIAAENLPERFRTPGAVPPPEAGAAAPGDIPATGVDLNAVLDAIERDFIVKALKRSGGVKSRAAQLLGLNRTTLIEKIKKKGITLDVEKF
jgi:transcriptional regulator with GAF, ATPase, and Fis domain